MTPDYFEGKLSPERLDTPAYIVELEKLEKNLKKLKSVEEESGAEILLAMKAFSMHSLFGLIGKYLKGTTSSGLNEAYLAKEYFDGEIHVYSPAYLPVELQTLAEFADTIVFNSEAQLDKFEKMARKISQANGKNVHIGLRVNPEYSEVETAIYNPCAVGSRLGALRKNLSSDVAKKIDMLHFHALCEQNSDTLERVLAHFEEKFGELIKQVRFVNFGGGHHITRDDYDTQKLTSLIKNFYKRYPNIEKIYLEPGEAVALNAGVFAARVLEIVDNGGPIAILDCAAPCHMPDVLEMPYRPNIFGAGKMGEKKYSYNLGGRSCLAGDRIGAYSFDNPLEEGDILIFLDMAHYTMVKTNTFNGMNLPDIDTYSSTSGELKKIKEFGYPDFKSRL